MYLLRGDLPWRLLPPKLFAPMTTVQALLLRLARMGLWHAINRALLMTAREAEGRNASPSAGVIDSQLVQTRGGGYPRGFELRPSASPDWLSG